MTLEEYLRFEERSEVRHEYVNGYAYAMTGAVAGHHRIVSNVQVALHMAARGGPCVAYRESFRLRIGNDFYYPDVMVACGEPLPFTARATERPGLLVECALAEQLAHRSDREAARVRVGADAARLRARALRVPAGRVGPPTPDGGWATERVENAGTLDLSCPEVALTLDAIYEGLDVPLVPLRRREGRRGGVCRIAG
jgi:Uma2 family endonuclease